MPAAALRHVALAVSATALVLCGAAHAQADRTAEPEHAASPTLIPVAPEVTLRTRAANPAMLQASREFDALDRDSSGDLNADEAAADATLADGFRRADGNGNGRIDRDEYTARLRR